MKTWERDEIKIRLKVFKQNKGGGVYGKISIINRM